MRIARPARRVFIISLATVLCGSAAHPARAQIPTATGRSFTLTNLGTAYKLFIPDSYVHRPQDATDILVHFHGDPQTVWNNAAYAKLDAVVVTVNLGTVSSAYQNPYAADTNLFATLLNEARTTLRNQPDFADNLNFDKLAVSSFSAGYGAVREVLKNSTYFNDIDGMVLADTVYASFTSTSDHTPLDSQMTGFRDFATAAKNGTKTLTLSHSQVLTYTYCNTAETADDLMAWTGVTPSAYNVTGLGGLQFYRHAQTGEFEMFGALGDDATAHSKHLQTMGQFLDDLPLALVPEPGSAGMTLFAAAGATLSRRRQRRR
jgi:hypothetical protein